MGPRQGRGQRFGEGASERAQRGSRSPRSPKEIHSPRRQANPRMRKAINTNNHPVAAGETVGTSQKYKRYQYLVLRSVCLQVIPTVGITVGTAVGSSVGRL